MRTVAVLRWGCFWPSVAVALDGPAADEREVEGLGDPVRVVLDAHQGAVLTAEGHRQATVVGASDAQPDAAVYGMQFDVASLAGLAVEEAVLELADLVLVEVALMAEVIPLIHGHNVLAEEEVEEGMPVLVAAGVEVAVMVLPVGAQDVGLPHDRGRDLSGFGHVRRVRLRRQGRGGLHGITELNEIRQHGNPPCWTGNLA